MCLWITSNINGVFTKITFFDVLLNTLSFFEFPTGDLK